MNYQNGAPDPNGGVVVAVVISVETGEIITVEDIAHPDPLQKLAGGTIEAYDASMESALLREIEEETGVPMGELEIFKTPTNGKIQFPLSVLARNKQHYFHGYVVLAKNFSMVHKKPRQDGESLLKVNIHQDADAVLRQRMVPQHRVIFTKVLNMVK